MNKIIGLMACWCAEDWVEMSLKQMCDLCDEVFVNVSAHSPTMEQFADSTYEKVIEFSVKNEKVQVVEVDNFNLINHSEVKSNIFNIMLTKSKLFEPGNWIWTFDADEFYHPEAMEHVRTIMSFTDRPFNQILFKERYFYIDTKHYLKGEHNRLFKIEQENMNPQFRFVPTQKWSSRIKNVAFIPMQIGMFHYGMLLNPFAKMEFWKTEYPNTTQSRKVLWLDKIYRNYDLRNEEFWVEENRKLFDIKSPWFAKDFEPDSQGHLFNYNEKHIDLIEESGLTQTNDFRDKFGF
jgi:hypothetical protein